MKNQEIYLILQKILHCFAKYLPLDDMQRSHRPKQIQKPFLEAASKNLVRLK